MAGSLRKHCCNAFLSRALSSSSILRDSKDFFLSNSAALRIIYRYPSSCCYSTGRGDSDSGKQNGRRWNATWSAIRNEWKIIGTLAIAAISWYVNAQQDRKEIRREIQLNVVTKQLKELYGPLYGNRIVAEANYRAAMREHGGLKRYLRRAQDTKDGEMIRVWRGYVANVLIPIDQQALNLIVNNAHLIADRDFPEEFETFLTHTAKMQFLMEHWKNQKGKLESIEEFNDRDYLEETNSSGMGGSKKIITYLRERCRILREKQHKYTEELNVEALHVRLINKVFK